MGEKIKPDGNDGGTKDTPFPRTIEQIMTPVGNVHKMRNERGKPALFRSTDRAYKVFFDETAALNPDGYLIGIGAGSIFSMLRLFTQEPKGLIAADVNPDVVIAGRVMIDELKHSVDYNEFHRNFFDLSADEYNLKAVNAMRGDDRLIISYAGWKGPVGNPMDIPQVSEDDLPIDLIDAREAISANFDLLQRMARSGKIAYCLTDIADPEFITAARKLPDYQTSNNVIFLTNFLDFRYGDGYLAPIENIGLLDTDNDDAIFIAAPHHWRGYVQTYRGFTKLLAAHRIYREELPEPSDKIT